MYTTTSSAASAGGGGGSIGGGGAHTQRFLRDPTRELTAYGVFHNDHTQKTTETYSTLR